MSTSQVSVGELDPVGVRVAPRAVVGLVQDDVVALVQQVGRDQSRHPAPDDGDPHDIPLSCPAACLTNARWLERSI